MNVGQAVDAYMPAVSHKSSGTGGKEWQTRRGGTRRHPPSAAGHVGVEHLMYTAIRAMLVLTEPRITHGVLQKELSFSLRICKTTMGTQRAQ